MFNWLKKFKKDKREKIFINVAKDFTDAPGCRYPDESDFSGELFRESLLFPKFKEAVLSDKILVVNLDGAFGYACAFLDEAFGGLIRVHNLSFKIISAKIEIITLEEPGLEEEIMNYCKKAEKEK